RRRDGGWTASSLGAGHSRTVHRRYTISHGASTREVLTNATPERRRVAFADVARCAHARGRLPKRLFVVRAVEEHLARRVATITEEHRGEPITAEARHVHV